MTNILAVAETIARNAHSGQLYGGKDYVAAHVIPIVSTINRLGYNDLHQAAGWLHNTIEDTKVTADLLKRYGIPTQVICAVQTMTKHASESHNAYLQRVLSNPMSIVVKFVDSSINLANTLLNSSDMNVADFRQLTDEYTRNIAVLRPRLPSPYTVIG
ncbi:MAG: hypothetical protein PVI21_03520 [Candidatus Woesebacteria bacterium]|jgi:(p)ppGpp synthase/HD superfamily hydrolase